MFSDRDQSGSSALTLVMVLVHLCQRKHDVLGVNNWTSSDSLSQIAMAWIAQIISHQFVLRCSTTGHIVGVVGGDRWRPE